MFIHAVALVRSAAVRRVLDLGAAFAVVVAAAASHRADAYWTAICTAVLLFEYVYPPSLVLGGCIAVAAHSVAVGEFQVKHVGAIVVALASGVQQWGERKQWRTRT